MLMQVASALRHIYDLGFVYNYLTADHLVVCAGSITACRGRGEHTLVKLIDFTNARLLADDTEFTLPLPTHRSPKAWTTGAVDVSTEIFSFGMLIAEVVLVTKDKFLFNFPSDEAEIVLGEAIKSGVRPILPDTFPIDRNIKLIAQRCWGMFNKWDRVQADLEFLEKTLDNARIVQSPKEKDARYEFISLQAEW